jgi:hypothetical protein
LKPLGNVRQDSILTNRDLESIEAKIYEEHDEELVARQSFGLKTDDGPGAETIGYDMISKRGAAKIMNSDSEDVPLVDADIVRKTQKVVSIKAGFKVTPQEIRAARQANKPVETTKAGTARRAIAEGENRLVYKGDAKVDIKGVINATGITIYTAADVDTGAGTKITWATKTATEIIEDIRIAKFEKLDVNPGIVADTLELPPIQFGKLSQKIGQGEGTIMQYLKEQGWFPGGIKSNPELKQAGDGNTDCMLMYDSRSENVEIGVPMDMMMHPPVVDKNNAQQVNLEERTAGAIVRYPLAICLVIGI